MTDWHLYMIRAADGSLYTGVATDVDRRLVEHEEGTRGARYLRGRAPLTLVYRQPVGDRGLALRMERRVKRLSKAEKERLVAEAPDSGELFDRLRMEEDA